MPKCVLIEPSKPSTGSQRQHRSTVEDFLGPNYSRVRTLAQVILHHQLNFGIDLRKLDSELRNDVQLICDIKNRSIEHTISLLRQISSLQSDLSEIPSDLTSLEAELRNKAGFSHLQRLHHMLYMYGATLVEVVRRKEFGECFDDSLL